MIRNLNTLFKKYEKYLQHSSKKNMKEWLDISINLKTPTMLGDVEVIEHSIPLPVLYLREYGEMFPHLVELDNKNLNTVPVPVFDNKIIYMIPDSLIYFEGSSVFHEIIKRKELFEKHGELFFLLGKKAPQLDSIADFLTKQACPMHLGISYYLFLHKSIPDYIKIFVEDNHIVILRDENSFIRHPFSLGVYWFSLIRYLISFRMVNHLNVDENIFNIPDIVNLLISEPEFIKNNFDYLSQVKVFNKTFIDFLSEKGLILESLFTLNL